MVFIKFQIIGLLNILRSE